MDVSHVMDPHIKFQERTCFCQLLNLFSIEYCTKLSNRITKLQQNISSTKQKLNSRFNQMLPIAHVFILI